MVPCEFAGTDSQSTSIQILGKRLHFMIKYQHHFKSYSCSFFSSMPQSKVAWVGDPMTQVLTFLIRSHTVNSKLQCRWQLPPGVSEMLEAWRRCIQGVEEGGQTPLFLRPSFVRHTALAHMISTAAPGDRKDPELAEAFSPDNLSALIERQRVSAEWLYGVSIDFSSLCLRLVSVSFGGGYCYYKQHESCLC